MLQFVVIVDEHKKNLNVWNDMGVLKHNTTGIILCMHAANERQRNNVTSLIDCAHAQNGPCTTWRKDD